MLPGIHTLRIKVKNPAKKTVSAKKRFSRPWISDVYFAAGDFDWQIDVPPLGDLVPNSGNLSFTAGASESVANAPTTAKITAGVYVYKYKKNIKIVEEYNSGGPEEVEKEVITPVPDKPIHMFINEKIFSLSQEGINFPPIKWTGKGNVGEGDKYPVFIKAELTSTEDVQGLIYTNWQDNAGWENDVILGDPTFMQVSPNVADKVENALLEIERLECEYKKEVDRLLNYRSNYYSTDTSNWAMKLRVNGARDEDILQLQRERKESIYNQVKGEITRLREIKEAQISSISIELLVDIQPDANKIWFEKMKDELNINKNVIIGKSPTFKTNLNNILPGLYVN